MRLSLQAHPSAAQARGASPARTRPNIPLAAPTRNYRDPSHKPEILVAFARSRRWGIRPIALSVASRARLPFRSSNRSYNLVSRPGRKLMGWGPCSPPGPPRLADLDVLVPAVLDGALRLHVVRANEFRRRRERKCWSSASFILATRASWRRDAAEPDQPRARRGHLPPGRQPARLSHGMGFEAMANSDNVLRGGLTPKHVDVPELLRVLDFTHGRRHPEPPYRRGQGHRTRIRTLPRVRGVGVRLEVNSSVTRSQPRRATTHSALLCTEGSAQFHASRAG